MLLEIAFADPIRIPFVEERSRVHGYSGHLASVAAFRRCQHAQWVGPVDRGDGARAEAAFAAAGFVFQRA